ncbi:MAG: tRNA (adenine(22)-N(1))-methyltransferase TrmK [Prevotellaceae bacterium]|jgi:tRNA1Val (adenine37-N6)-methyltransferase|nr:tRNA (adenine(22)-N(1))-methyltransferase TrmK [Prevotellaceae bacterium]
MNNKNFTFKQFVIEQEKSAMKVGIDGVILGAWVDVANAVDILDVGTGTGLIAIMIAQRNSIAHIDAVEIDRQAYEQAAENVNKCKWKERINVIHEKFQTFAQTAQKRYDLIVSNPPYFIASLQSPEMQRTVARHSVLLSQDDLISGIGNLLADTGKFAAIFPYIEANVFIAKAAVQNLFCNKKTNIKPNPDKPVKRIMLEFLRTKQNLAENTVCIETGKRHDYTDEYKTLTKDFYLKF